MGRYTGKNTEQGSKIICEFTPQFIFVNVFRYKLPNMLRNIICVLSTANNGSSELPLGMCIQEESGRNGRYACLERVCVSQCV